MTSEERRLRIIDILSNLTSPISGTMLAEKLNVSRQIIVQDIALLRAENKNIISTNKGYMFYKSNHHTYREEICVIHNESKVLEEFYTIVDHGGTILNVSIRHDLYGNITADLYISNRTDADLFYDKMKICKDKPLSLLTDEFHYHIIETKDKVTMEIIKQKLSTLGILSKQCVTVPT